MDEITDATMMSECGPKSLVDKRCDRLNHECNNGCLNKSVRNGFVNGSLLNEISIHQISHQSQSTMHGREIIQQ